MIKEVDERVEQVFTAAYHDTAREFEGVFSRLFPGGEGRLVLTDPDNMLTTGVEVEARPPGKKVKRLSLLSGGERSLTAVAMLVSIFKARPSPFYVMDEVEAALDDTNLQRLIRIMEELQESSQLIVITHQKRTMEVADALYGVSMQGDGVSKVISQRLRGSAKRLTRAACKCLGAPRYPASVTSKSCRHVLRRRPTSSGGRAESATLEDPDPHVRAHRRARGAHRDEHRTSGRDVRTTEPPTGAPRPRHLHHRRGRDGRLPLRLRQLRDQRRRRGDPEQVRHRLRRRSAQVIAIALIGCAIGAATAGRIADRIGRIRCMQIAAVLFTISAVGSALPVRAVGPGHVADHRRLRASAWPR